MKYRIEQEGNADFSSLLYNSRESAERASKYLNSVLGSGGSRFYVVFVNKAGGGVRFVDLTRYMEKINHGEGVKGSKYETILVRGGRTGQKLHLAVVGSSCLYCGRWVKHGVVHFQVRDLTRIPVKDLCEKCFGDEALKEITRFGK